MVSASLAAPGFGDILRAWREAAGLSQSALAKRVGVDASYVNRIESGQRGVERRDVVLGFAQALGLGPVETDRLLLAAGFLPEALHQLGPNDPTLTLVANVLTNPQLSPEERQLFRQIVNAIARRWLGLPVSSD